VKAIFLAGLGAALLSSSTYAQQTQVAGQPMLRAPAPMAPEDLRSHPNFGQPASKLPRAAKAPSTPESRSAAALALSADPVFDEGTTSAWSGRRRNPQRPLKRMQLDLGLVRAAPKSARIAK
jgi:hypothetical protein